MFDDCCGDVVGSGDGSDDDGDDDDKDTLTSLFTIILI